jgi:hypothetical protein
MRKYTVLAVLGIAPGTILGLSHDQAAPRAHALKAIDLDSKSKMGTYEVLSRVEFKAGETIYTAAELNKATASALEPVETTRDKAAEKKRAEAEAKDVALLRDKAARWDQVESTLADLTTKGKAWDDLQPDLEALRGKAKVLDDLQPELEGLQTKAALWDRLPEGVRADAVQKAEAELKAEAKPAKK